MRDFERLAEALTDIFADTPLPKTREVRQVLAATRVLDGGLSDVVAVDFKLQRRGLQLLVERIRAGGLAGLAPYADRVTIDALTKRRQGIAQMLLGALAERRFEELINHVTGGGVLQIEDHRPSRTNTDYRLLNGNNNPICRFNVKFHGSLFREARRYVGLDPDDCFALATYKINNALRRQELEKLPYIFLVLSVPDLSAADVGRPIPDDYVWALAALEGKRVSRKRSLRGFPAMTISRSFGPSLKGCPKVSSA